MNAKLNDPCGNPSVTREGAAEPYIFFERTDGKYKMLLKSLESLKHIFFSEFNFIQPLKEFLYILSCGY